MNLKSGKLEQLSPRARGVVTALFVLAALPPQAAAEENGYMREMLDSPSSSVLSAEAKGRVTIYDGLRDETVERALDQQFERMQNMMFIRTQHQQEVGDYQADDDC